MLNMIGGRVVFSRVAVTAKTFLHCIQNQIDLYRHVRKFYYDLIADYNRFIC